MTQGGYHHASALGLNDPNFSVELAADMLDNGFDVVGEPSILFGPLKTGRAKNKLGSDPNATGPHTTFKREPNTGDIIGYETYGPSDPRNPNPWESQKRVDLQGKSHYDKKTGQDILTPHVHEPVGNVRPARPDEIP